MLRAGRMMIEQASQPVLEAITTALDVVLPAQAAQWLDLARSAQVPLIVGWDLRDGGEERCVKLYVNASDVSYEARARLCAALVPAANGAIAPPAVVGMNARADGRIETKVYVQSANAVALAQPLNARAGKLAAAAHDEGADAGGVLSFDIEDDQRSARAFFVALREPAGDAGWECVRSLPGYDRRRIESLLPFAPAPPRSVGISLADDAWTLYYKPRESGRAPEALEPAAIFRSGDAEVGVFIEPTEHAIRAFRRTDRHAVSIRIRDGSPAPLALESLIDWFTARLSAAERDGVHLGGRLTDPPAPWRIVMATQSLRGDGKSR